MTEHYYSKKQTSELKLSKINVRIFNKYYEFYTGSGTFSPKKLDRGTEVLLKNAIIKPKILDLGCGWGVIGIVLKKEYPKIEITMSDINERAIKLTKMNAKFHKIKPIIKQSNLYEKITDKFDTILSNPPQSAGKKICFEIIENSINYLNKEGLLQLVARHNKGGKQLSEKMKEVFGNVKDIAKKSGYRVYVSKKE